MTAFLHFSVFVAGSFSGDAPNIRVQEMGTGYPGSSGYDLVTDPRFSNFYTSVAYNQTSTSPEDDVGNPAYGFVYNLPGLDSGGAFTGMTIDGDDFSGGVAQRSDYYDDGGNFADSTIDFEVSPGAWRVVAIAAEMTEEMFELRRPSSPYPGTHRQFRFLLTNGLSDSALSIKDCWIDFAEAVGLIPPLRMLQRDDGLGISGHARLFNGGFNQPSSVSLSRAPRLSGTEQNRYV